MPHLIRRTIYRNNYRIKQYNYQSDNFTRIHKMDAFLFSVYWKIVKEISGSPLIIPEYSSTTPEIKVGRTMSPALTIHMACPITK